MTSDIRQKRILVLGASSAIAEATARRFAIAGAHLFLAGRSESRLRAIAEDLMIRGAARAEVFAADLARPEDQPSLFARMLAAAGGQFDIVLLAYGMLPDHSRAQGSHSETIEAINVNFVSAVGWITLAAEQMANADAGTIAVITSVAGERGRASNYVYGAAKGGLSRYLEGLWHRFSRSGVKIIDIRAGFVDTPMTANVAKGPLWASPDRVAADIVKAIRTGRPVVYSPGFWRWIMLIIRNLPRMIFSRLRI